MKLLEKNYVRYGLGMCAILIACLLVMEITGQNQTFEKSPFVAFWTFIFPALVWFFGIRAYKKELKGKMTWKQGVKEGFRISVVFAIVSPFIFLLYYTLINPGIIPYLLKTYGMPNADVPMIIAVDMLAQFFSAIIGGTFYGAVISFFLKTKSSKK